MIKPYDNTYFFAYWVIGLELGFKCHVSYGRYIYGSWQQLLMLNRDKVSEKSAEGSCRTQESQASLPLLQVCLYTSRKSLLSAFFFASGFLFASWWYVVYPFIQVLFTLWAFMSPLSVSGHKFSALLLSVSAHRMDVADL